MPSNLYPISVASRHLMSGAGGRAMETAFWVARAEAALACSGRERLLATPGRAEAVIISGDHVHVAVVQHVPAYAGCD
jgi:hypothetical protein